MRPQTVSDKEILTVAREVFLAMGYSAPVTAVSDKLGISQPALFKRYKTKQNLFIEAMRPPEEIVWFDFVDAGPDKRPFEEQFKELSGLLYAFFYFVGPIIQVVKSSNIPVENFLRDGELPMPVRSVQKLRSWIERCVEKGLIREVDSNLTAVSILGTFQMTTFMGTFAPEDERKRARSQFRLHVENLLALYMHGVEKK